MNIALRTAHNNDMGSKYNQQVTVFTALFLASMPACSVFESAERNYRPQLDRSSFDRFLKTETQSELSKMNLEFRPGEYVVPDAVLKSYVCAVSRAVSLLEETSAGGYIARDRLDSPRKLEVFKHAMKEAGYDRESTDAFETLLRQGDAIIISETSVANGFIKVVLPHERFHQEMKRLSPENQAHMREVSLQIRAMIDAEGNYLIQERPGNRGVVQMAVLSGSYEEFYAYLADGKLNALAEQKLLEISPKAHALWVIVRDATR